MLVNNSLSSSAAAFSRLNWFVRETLPNSSEWLGECSEGLDGTGTENDPWIIASAADLFYALTKIGNTEGQHFKFTHNIDFIEYEKNQWGYYKLISYDKWMDVLKEQTDPFSGIIEGNGAVLKNLKIVNTEGKDISIFGQISNAKISNLTIDKSVELVSRGDIESQDKKNGGNVGFIGKASGNIVLNKIENRGSYKSIGANGDVDSNVSGGNGGNVGVISAAVEQNTSVTMTDCVNYGDISSIGGAHNGNGGNAGGLVGSSVGTITMDNCANAGGIVSIGGGSVSKDENNNSNSGEGGSAGGLVGTCESIVFEGESGNAGAVSSTAGANASSELGFSALYCDGGKGGNAGGVVGRSEVSIEVKDGSVLVNKGIVMAAGSKSLTGNGGDGGVAGGLFGCCNVLTGEDGAKIKNFGGVSASGGKTLNAARGLGGCAGGIVGQATSVSLNFAVNNGQVFAMGGSTEEKVSYAGAAVAEITGDARINRFVNGAFALINSSRGAKAVEAATGGYAGVVGKSGGAVTLNHVINYAEIKSNGDMTTALGGNAGLVGEAVGDVLIINSQNKGMIRAEGGLASLVCKSSGTVEINNSANLGELLGNEKTLVGEGVTGLIVNNFYMVSDYKESIVKDGNTTKTIKNFYWATEGEIAAPDISDVHFMESEEMREDSFATQLNKNASVYMNEIEDNESLDVSGWMGNRKEMNCYPMVCPGESPDDLMYLETKRKNDEQYRKLKSEVTPAKEHNLLDENGTEGLINGSPIGSGNSELDPFIIDCTAAWNWIAENSDTQNHFAGKYFKLTQNIGCTDTKLKKIENFKGVLDGNGAIIKGSNANLFGTIHNATIKDLLIDCNKEISLPDEDGTETGIEKPLGDGTEDNPYILLNYDTWAWLAENSTEDNDYFNGTYFLMICDVGKANCSLQTINKFKGTINTYSNWDLDLYAGNPFEGGDITEANISSRLEFKNPDDDDCGVECVLSDRPFGSGTELDPYLLDCTAAWNFVCTVCRDKCNFENKHLKLIKNIGIKGSQSKIPSSFKGKVHLLDGVVHTELDSSFVDEYGNNVLADQFVSSDLFNNCVIDVTSGKCNLINLENRSHLKSFKGEPVGLVAKAESLSPSDDDILCLSNCVNYGDMYSAGEPEKRLGNNFTVNEGDEAKDGGNAGGLIGESYISVYFYSCGNYGDICSLGGGTPVIMYDITDDLYHSRDRDIYSYKGGSGKNAGGLIGKSEKCVTISGVCENLGKIESSSGAYYDSNERAQVGLAGNGGNVGGCVGLANDSIIVLRNASFGNKGEICADGGLGGSKGLTVARQNVDFAGSSGDCKLSSDQRIGGTAGTAGGLIGCLAGKLESEGKIENYGNVSANGGNTLQCVLGFNNSKNGENDLDRDEVDFRLAGDGGAAGGIIGKFAGNDSNKTSIKISGDSRNYGDILAKGGNAGFGFLKVRDGNYDDVGYCRFGVICGGLGVLREVAGEPSPPDWASEPDSDGLHPGNGGNGGKAGACIGSIEAAGEVLINGFVDEKDCVVNTFGGNGGKFIPNDEVAGIAEANPNFLDDIYLNGESGQGGTAGVIGYTDSNLNIINSHVTGSEFSAGENGLSGFLGDAGGTLNIRNSSFRGKINATGDNGSAGFIGRARNKFSLLSNNNYISCEINSEKPGLLFGDTGENVSANLENTYVDCEDEQTEFANYKTGTKPNITGKGTNRGDIRTNAFLAQLNTNAKAIDGANGWLRLNSNDGYPITLCNQADPGSLLLGRTNAPEMEYKTDTSVVLKDGGPRNYSKDANAWQKSTEFSGLNPDNEYTFYAKKVSWGQVEGEGAVSEGTKITTIPTRVHESLKEAEDEKYPTNENLGAVEKELYDKVTGIYCMFARGSYVDGYNLTAERVDKYHANYKFILGDVDDTSDFEYANYYSISLTNEDGIEMQPNGLIVLLIPVPEHFDLTEEDLSGWCVETGEDERFDNNENLVMYKGRPYYMIVTPHLSNWALVDRITENDRQPEKEKIPEEPADEKENPKPKEEGPADEKEIPEPKEEEPADEKEIPEPKEEEPADEKEIPEPKEEEPAEVKEIPEPKKEEPADMKTESAVEEEYEDEDEQDEDSTEEESKAVELALGDNASMVQITCAFLGLMLSTVLFNLKRKQQSR